MSPFDRLRQKTLLSYLDKYPNVPSNQLARMLFRDYPEYFISKEHIRRSLRYYRGADGLKSKLSAKNAGHGKYFRMAGDI